MPRVHALAGLSTMINVLMLIPSQVVDGSPRLLAFCDSGLLCDQDKPKATNNTLHPKPFNSIIESQV
jgi:hypothetical protein